MKKTQLIILFIAFLILPLQQVKAVTIPDPIGHIYVQDFAQILSANEKKELEEIAMYLDDKVGAQIAVLTIPSLEGVPVEEYAVEAFRKYELGDKEKDNGILLLLALQERKIFIEIGYGLEGILPDGKVGRILDTYALPYLLEGNLAEAITNTYKQLYNEVAVEYQLDQKAETTSYEYGYESPNEGPSLLTIIILVLFFLGFVFLDFRFFGGALTLGLIRILAVMSRFRGGGGSGGGPRSGGGGSAGGGGAGRSW